MNIKVMILLLEHEKRTNVRFGQVISLDYA